MSLKAFPFSPWMASSKKSTLYASLKIISFRKKKKKTTDDAQAPEELVSQCTHRRFLQITAEAREVSSLSALP